MFYIMLDTCVLLDISTKKSGYPVVSAIEALTSSGIINLVIPDIVITEFEKTKMRLQTGLVNGYPMSSSK